MSREFIGFDRALRLEWLDLAATIAIQRMDLSEARPQMRTQLEGQLEGDNALVKTVRVIQRIWFPEEADHRRLRDDAAAIITQVPERERVAVHWSLTLATYPFFVDCAAAVGRLLRLQPSFTGTQVKRRLVDQWGDRDIVDRARRHVLQTLVWWDALSLVSKSGVYVSRPSQPVTDIRCERLLLHAVLLSTSGIEQTTTDVLRSPVIYPFELTHDAATIMSDDRFTVSTTGGSRRVVSVTG